MTEMYEDDDRRLDAAVRLGLISAEQAQAIRALTPERTRPDIARPVGAPEIGYVLGAITVLVAMAWFLADRWRWLGAGGVIAVVAIYLALFIVVGRRLLRDGNETAGGISVLLAVAMVPVGVIALNEWAKWIIPWPAAGCNARWYGEPVSFDFWGCRGLEVVVLLATLAAALIALRAVRFSMLALPIGAIGLRGVFLAVTAVFADALGSASIGWVWMMGASITTAAAYIVDRSQRGDKDYALWVHALGVFAAVVTTAMLLNTHESLRHLLIPGAVVAFAFSLRMRRMSWTFLGIGWFVTYLAWLASDVFEDTPFFPIVLAALGLAVIISTVWVQRNSARLVARFGGLATDGRPSFPGGAWLLMLPVLVAALHLPASVALDVAEKRLNLASMRSYRALEVRREAAETRSRAKP
jgi:hypothetical protein